MSTVRTNSSLTRDLLAFYRFMESMDATGDWLGKLFSDIYASKGVEARAVAVITWAEYSTLLERLREHIGALDAEAL